MLRTWVLLAGPPRPNELQRPLAAHFAQRKLLYLSRVPCSMKALQRRDLFQIVADDGGLSEDDAQPFFSQMLSCIRSLHDAGICHCDLGIESFVFASSSADHLTLIHTHSSHQYPWDTMVGDFNRTVLPPQSKKINYLYAAPENVCSFEADMWSLGLCLFAMVTNTVPVYDRNTAAPFSSMLDSTFSSEFVDLIDRLTAFDPQQRLGAMEAAQHPWVLGSVCASREMPDASTTSISYLQQRQCVQCGTTETRAWRCQGTLCNACGLRKPGGVSKPKQIQIREQLLAAGFTIEQSAHASFSIHSPDGCSFRSIKGAYKFYMERNQM